MQTTLVPHVPSRQHRNQVAHVILLVIHGKEYVVLAVVVYRCLRALCALLEKYF
jgi:hypothetical protein